jgi:hypothetical protein
LAGLDGAGEAAFCGVVEGLPFEAAAYGEANLTNGGDLCVIRVGRYRQLAVHPVAEFVEVTDIFWRGALVRMDGGAVGWPLVAEAVTQIGREWHREEAALGLASFGQIGCAIDEDADAERAESCPDFQSYHLARDSAGEIGTGDEIGAWLLAP